MVRTRAKMDIRVDNLERNLAEMREEQDRKLLEVQQELRSAMNDQRLAMENLAASMAAMNEQLRTRERSRSQPRHHLRSSRSPTTSGGNPNLSHIQNPPVGNHVLSPIPNHRRPDDMYRFPVYTGRKIDLPVFDGEGAYSWIVRMERYFRLNNINEEEQVEAAVVAMEGRAINWFIWWEHQNERRTWENLKTSIVRRFQPDLIQNPYGPMLSLKQTGTVRDYRDEFELVIAPQINVDMEILKGIFLNGLKNEIKAELKLHNSTALNDIMDMALLVETRNEAIYLKTNGEDKVTWKEKGPSATKHQTWVDGFKAKIGNSGSNNNGKGAAESMDFNSWFEKMGKKVTEINNSEIRKVGPQLSQEEFQERSRKGLCFKCGEKWSKEHNCKLKNYKLMMVEDSDGEKEHDKDSESSEEEVTMESKSMQLSFMNQEGTPSMRAFKVQGILKWVKGEKIVDVLIDSGASHNFISQKLVGQISLPYHTTSGYKVQTGNGDVVFNNGKCEKLILNMQGTVIQQKFYIMELGGADLVLGMEWLTSLGDVEVNFQKQSIKWQQFGTNQVIQEDPQFNSTEESLQTMVQIIQDTGDGYPVSCEGRIEERKEGQQKDHIRKDILAEFPYASFFFRPQIAAGSAPFISLCAPIICGLQGSYWKAFLKNSEMESAISIDQFLDIHVDRISTRETRFSRSVAAEIKELGSYLEGLHKTAKFQIQDNKELYENAGNALEKYWSEEVRIKGPMLLIGIQKSTLYWEGRSARKKYKWEIMADSYHPP
ncbi:unnamed protein product [Cuscuta epithymum]|uniref:Retrotransposon gag domain-containing protein n=1 Tax=Cuscuta epithymum TaxID=186058 RepID=A0AAV0E2V9_9ASTE|nr:unnamed protein product [Cuscuta epithymum]